MLTDTEACQACCPSGAAGGVGVQDKSYSRWTWEDLSRLAAQAGPGSQLPPASAGSSHAWFEHPTPLRSHASAGPLPHRPSLYLVVNPKVGVEHQIAAIEFVGQMHVAPVAIRVVVLGAVLLRSGAQ